MKKSLGLLILGMVILFSLSGCGGSGNNSPDAPPTTPSISSSAIVYQDFENTSHPGFNTIDSWAYWGVSAGLDRTHADGTNALKITTTSDNESGLYIIDKSASWDVNLNSSGTNTKISFWIYAVPTSANCNYIGLGIKDSDTNFAKVWTDSLTAPQPFNANGWTKISIPFAVIQSNITYHVSDGSSIDFTHINHIEINFANTGTYYIDDIVAE
jgi:hypothetical protein